MNMRYMKSGRARSKESGYVLLALMLTLTLMLIALSVEAPRIAQQIKRDKEEEMVHRGKDYATAVKRFVHKNGGRYPASIEQLENTNHIRFLRKKYVDPMTGESDWKMVHVGEAQINIPAPQNKAGTLPTSSLTQSSQPNNPNTAGGGGGGIANSGGIANTGGTSSGSSSGFNGTLQTSNIGNGQTVGGGQIMGVASVSKRHSIKEFNDKDEYDQWYFVYDLRLEQSGGSGVTVAAPRAGGTTTGSSSASGTPGATGSPNASGQPTPVGTPAPSPTPQN
jgi:type II secretory pathway pseudopilin PulG